MEAVDVGRVYCQGKAWYVIRDLVRWAVVVVAGLRCVLHLDDFLDAGWGDEVVISISRLNDTIISSQRPQIPQLAHRS